MKSKRQILTIIFLLLIVNTTYFWEGKLGFLPFSLILLLVVFDLWLLIILIRQIYLCSGEKFTKKNRIVTIGVLSISLVISIYRQYKLFDIDKFQEKELLVAVRGDQGPNSRCVTTIKFYRNQIFQEKNLCNGISTVKGTYRISNDTIYFENVRLGKLEDVKYEFGFIEELELYTENKYALKLLKNKRDSLVFYYFIGKNELNIKPIRKPNS